MKTENFALLNLIKALGSLKHNEEQSQPVRRVAEETEKSVSDDNLNGKNKNESGGESHINVLAGIIERHEQISNRLHGKKH